LKKVYQERKSLEMANKLDDYVVLAILILAGLVIYLILDRPAEVLAFLAWMFGGGR
jgi:hypothetical protein